MVLITVRNTGSHLALSILGQRFLRHSLYEIEKPDPLWFAHAETLQMPKIREHCEREPLVCTMRSPVEVAKSWIKRGRTLDKQFRSSWDNLFMLADQYNAMWMPVDTADRDERLAAISKAFGFDFKTDWARMGVFTGQRNYEGGMSLDEAVDWIKSRHGERFKEFGYF